jgi:hypothetical protein
MGIDAFKVELDSGFLPFRHALLHHGRVSIPGKKRVASRDHGDVSVPKRRLVRRPMDYLRFRTRSCSLMT